MASIDKRPNGRYRARWREFPGGPQRTKQFARKVDAERFLIDVQHRILTGVYVPPEAGQVTIRAYAEEWMGRRTWAPSTRERVERELKLHILPKLGDRPLASIRRAHVEEWVKGLKLSPSSANVSYRTLCALLAAAVEDDRLPRNPATGAKVPDGDDVPFVPLTAEQVRRIAHGAAEHIRAGVGAGGGHRAAPG